MSRCGQIKATYQPWLDAPASPSDANYASGLVTQYDYSLDHTGCRATRPSLQTTAVGTTMLSKSTVSYRDLPITEMVTQNGVNYTVTRYLVEATTKNYASANQYLASVATRYREDAGMGLLPGTSTYEATRGFLPNLPYSAVSEQGLRTTWAYIRGVYQPTLKSLIPSADGPEWQVTRKTEGLSGPVEAASTFETTIHSCLGLPIAQSSGVFLQAAWHTTSRSVFGYTRNFQRSSTAKDSGDDFSNSWTSDSGVWEGGQLVSTTDELGVQRDYAYNGAGMKVREVILAKGGFPAGDLTMVYAYDGAGRTVAVRKQSSAVAASDDLLSCSTYDGAGRLTSTSETGPNGNLVKTFAYYVDGNPRKTMTTLPSGATEVQESYLDGRRKSLSGTAYYGGGLAKTFYYGYDATSGEAYTKESPPHNGYTYTRTDWLGRTLYTTTPGYNNARVAQALTYEPTKGWVTRRETLLADANDGLTTSRLASPVLYSYDDSGRLTRECLDVNENGITEIGSADRITEYAYSGEAHTENVDNAVGVMGGITTLWQKTDIYSYPDNNSTRRLRQSTALTMLNKYALIEATGIAVYSAQTKKRGPLSANDGSDDDSLSEYTLTKVTRDTATVQSSTKTVGASNPAISTSINGFEASTLTPQGCLINKTYDGYGRLKTTQQRASIVTEYVYYPGTTAVKHIRGDGFSPANIGSEWQAYTYDAAGRIATEAVNNVGAWITKRYEYDLRGNRIRQWGAGETPCEYIFDAYGRCTQLKTFRNNTINWDAAAWPGAAATADTTTWNYDPSTGLVTSKVYPADGGSSTSVSFSYNSSNQVVSRTWGRGTTTQYAYYDGTFPSEGARGQLRQVSYPNSATTGQQVQTTPVVYAYARHGGVKSVADATGTRTFDYRPQDLQLLSETLPAFFGSEGKRLTYSYENGTNRIGDASLNGRASGFQLGTAGSPSAYQQVGYGYDDVSGRLEVLQTASGGSSQQTFTYTYEPGANLVKSLARNGGGFSRTMAWETTRDVVDVVKTKWNNIVLASYTYGYDWIRRRTLMSTQGAIATAVDPTGNGFGVRRGFGYTPRGDLDYTEVYRLATSNWLGATSGELTDRYWDCDFDPARNRTAEYRVRGSGTAQESYTTNARNQYTAKTGVNTVGYLYDDDGNLTSDGVWYYYWDAENRLSQMLNIVSGLRLDFTYDYLGRRVAKSVTPSGGSTATTCFIYNGWNLVVEYNAAAPLAMTRTYTWGLDMTSTVSGAGGVGGLLMGTNAAGTCLYPVYDANGNVHGYINGGTGALTVAYEYGPAGETVINTLLSANVSEQLPIRFASKYLDIETSLYQYNNRYYAPALGRFINRDPIAEHGGLNLYAYCHNDGANAWDYLGHREWRGLSPQEKMAMKFLKQFLGFHTGLHNSRSKFRIVEGMGRETYPIDLESPYIAHVTHYVDENGNIYTSRELLPPSSGGTASSDSSLGNALRHIPLLGGILGGVGDIVSGAFNIGAGILTFGQSGTFGTGFSEIGHGFGGVAMGSLDLVGKAWASPNTAIGLVAGLAGIPFGARIRFADNAIQFVNYPWGGDGALTLGNIQLYHNSAPGDPFRGYDNMGPALPTGRHEEGHTYQYQVLGPLFLPLYFINGGISGDNPMEKAADGYSRGGSYWPWSE